MQKSKIQLTMQKNIALILIIATAVLLRILPHPANVTPVAAMALFGGAYLPKKYALLLPIVVMALSDVVLGFHASIPFVYVSFVIAGLIGVMIRKKKTAGMVILASITSSVIFFIVTNFGFWLAHDLYPKTLAGQLEAYGMALPFFRNTLVGDLLYTGLFFGGYEVITRVFASLHDAKNLHKNRG